MSDYRYVVKGLDARGQDWTVTGVIRAAEGDFVLVPQAALKSTFQKLTSGKAVFGSPGIGCQGPYKMRSLLIETTDG